MVNKTQTNDAGINESTSGIVPEQPWEYSWNKEPHNKNQRQVMAMLPPYNGTLGEVAHISNAGLTTWLEEHPANVGVEEAFLGTVGVEVGVGIAVVGTVTTTPPFDGTFDGTSAAGGENILKGKTRIVGAVSPQAVVASSDAKAGDEVVEDGENKSLPAKGSEEGTNEAKGGGDGEDDGAEPVDFLVPFLPFDRGESLLGLQGVCNIVVWDVEVGGDDVVRGCGHLGGSRGRHGGRPGERRRRGTRRGQTAENICSGRLFCDQLIFRFVGDGPTARPAPAPNPFSQHLVGILFCNAWWAQTCVLPGPDTSAGLLRVANIVCMHSHVHIVHILWGLEC